MWEDSQQNNMVLTLSLVPTGDKLHRPSSSPETNVVGTIKGSPSNFHRRQWVGRWWISKSFDIHHPNTWAFFYVGKDVKIKYASSNFSL